MLWSDFQRAFCLFNYNISVYLFLTGTMKDPGGRGVLPYKKVPLRVFRIEWYTVGAFAVPFRVISWKNMTGDNCVVLLVHVPLRDEKHFKPRLRNSILVPLRGLISKFPMSIPILLIWNSPPPSPSGRIKCSMFVIFLQFPRNIIL